MDEAVSISHGNYTLGKGMNPTILPPSMGKLIGRLGSLNLGMTTYQGEEKLCFKIDLVLHPIHTEALGKFIHLPFR